MPLFRFALFVVLALAQLPYARQAIELAHTRDDALLAAFHRGYQLPLGDALNRAEIVTEFRRAVMIVREHADHGEYVFSEQSLAKEMTPFDGQVTFIVEVRLHPLHTYSGAPPYSLYIETGPSSKPLAPKPFKRDPAYPPGMAAPGNPISGVLMEGTFDRDAIAAASAPFLIVTDDQANVLWKARIDLARYR